MSELRGYRNFQFAGQFVGLEWAGEEAARIVRTLVGDHPKESSCLPNIIFRLHTCPETRALTIVERNNLLYRGSDLGGGALALMKAIMTRLIHECATGLILHSALLARGTAGILMSGPSGVGKSTLSAWLCGQGLAYHGDELVYATGPQSTLQGLTRPLCLKGAWREILRLPRVDSRVLLETAGQSMVPASAIGPIPDGFDPHPRIVLFPRYQQGAEFALNPLSPGRAALRLSEAVVNARNLPLRGMRMIAGLARKVPAFELAYGSFGQLAPLVAKIAQLG